MARTRRGPAFWLIFAALCISLFASALEMTTISTALPVIAHDLRMSGFVWAGTAYTLASTAFLPMSGGLAEVFGRQHAMLLCVTLFALGSGLCGAAKEQSLFLAGRAVQGLGGGGIRSLSVIILADLVTLEERGVYGVFTGLTWCVAAVVGPVIGGSLASQGYWRWLFYLNLPVCFVAALCVLLFLQLPIPNGTIRNKLSRLDWIGNALVIASTVSCTVGLTWGSSVAPWLSLPVLLPLWCGLLGLAIFMLYEAMMANEPLVPFIIMSNRTTLSGYAQASILSLVTICVIYLLPVYFQGCKDTSALRSAVLGLGVAALAPAAVFAGVSVTKTGRYRPQMWAGWCILLVGLGLLRTVRQNTPIAHAVVYGALIGVGLGLEYSTTMFPVQAPLPVSQSARALAFLAFAGSFAGVWGLSLGAAVLDNQLRVRLSAAFLQQLPHGAASVAYDVIPRLASLPAPERMDVQIALADSLAMVWTVLMGVAAIGLLASLFMQGLPLHSKLDSRWALRDRSPRSSALRFEMVTPQVIQVHLNPEGCGGKL